VGDSRVFVLFAERAKYDNAWVWFCIFHRRHKYVQDTAGKEYKDPLILLATRKFAPYSGRSLIPPNARTPPSPSYEALLQV
jgi:hypothetical protein